MCRIWQVELTKERKAAPPDPAWPEFEYGNPGSFKRGLATLPNAISVALGQPVGEAAKEDAKVKLQWKLTSLAPADGGRYLATYDTPEGERTVLAKAVVSTAPAHALSDVLTPVMPESKAIFEKARAEIARRGIYHPPVAAVTVAYPKAAFKDVEVCMHRRSKSRPLATRAAEVPCSISRARSQPRPSTHTAPPLRTPSKHATYPSRRFINGAVGCRPQ